MATVYPYTITLECSVPRHFYFFIIVTGYTFSSALCCRIGVQ